MLPELWVRSYSVTARGLSAVQVDGPNWITALGQGLERLGRGEGVNRLACEVLPNGTVIARDISSGTSYIVQEVDGEPESTAPAAEELEELEVLPADFLGEEDDEAPDVEDVVTADSVADACAVALAVARELVPAESGAVILEEKGYLRFAAVTGPHGRKLVGVRLPIGTGVAGFSMEKRRTVILADAHEDPRHCGEVDALTGYVTRQILVLPVVRDDRVFGVLELMNLPEGRRFTGEDVDALHPIGEALARRLDRD